MDPDQLASFLKSRRERIAPAALGLPRGPRRRTPGLRREEVAALAEISVEYYTRLEQARGPHPSRQVLAQIDRALKLSPDERTHLYLMAGELPEPARLAPTEVPANVHALLARVGIAAIVLDAKFDIIAWNPLGVALLGDFAAMPARERNMVRRYFLHPDVAQRHFGLSPVHAFAAIAVSRIRRALARYPDDPAIRRLVVELLGHSDEFAAIWDAHDVRGSGHVRKTMVHPVLGPLELQCDVLLVPDLDQEVVMFAAQPGTASEQRWHELEALVVDCSSAGVGVASDDVRVTPEG